MIRLLLFIGLMLALGESAFAATDKVKNRSANETGASKMGLSQGVDRLLEEVYKRQKVLTKAEREVASREIAVAELERLIDERIASLEKGRQEIEDRITSWETKDGDRIQKLAKVYASMPPGNAARLLETLELDVAVAVLSKMKGKNSAQLLAAIDPKRALHISQRMVRPLSASPAAQSR